MDRSGPRGPAKGTKLLIGGGRGYRKIIIPIGASFLEEQRCTEAKEKSSPLKTQGESTTLFAAATLRTMQCIHIVGRGPRLGSLRKRRAC